MADLPGMGYRSKAQRLAEFRMLGKNAALSKTQINTLIKTLANTCDDLQHCAAVRARMAIKAYAVSSEHRTASFARKAKKS